MVTSLGNKIAQALKDSGHSRSHFSREVGMGRLTLAHRFRKGDTFTVGELKKITEFFGRAIGTWFE